MGCRSSLCTDSNELLLSQHLHEKEIDITIPVSEKSTNHSLNTLVNRNSKSIDSTKPAFLLKSFCLLCLKSFDYCEELIPISELWIAEVFKSFEESVTLSEDLRTLVSLDSSGSSLMIKHEIDGLRSFEKIAWFCQKIQSMTSHIKLEKFKYKNFVKSEEFLMSLGPLTITVYLKLGREIDCGIGIEKPLDRKQMSQFLSLSSEAKNIATWANGNGQPIPISCSFSTLSDRKSINFFIFDGMKEQNFTRALSAFYHFGAPVPEKLEQMISLSKAEEANCVLEFDSKCICSVSMIIQSGESGILGLKELDTQIDERAWMQMQNLLPAKYLALELSPQGFLLKKMAVI